MNEAWVILFFFFPGFVWIWLIFFRGQFWSCDQKMCDQYVLETFPSIVALIPARNEVETIGATILSLRNQIYSGKIEIIVIDDNSSDGTEIAARKAMCSRIIKSGDLPSGWTGKLWALHQGIKLIQKEFPKTEYILFTDADINHSKENILQLVSKASCENLDIVSLMVRLNSESFWERFLVPPFIFFFQMLYPFRWVNDPRKKIAAAAGGCMLIRKTALDRVDGVLQIKGCLIDDCALGKSIKSHGSIWLGLSEKTKSLRRYDQLVEIWSMVSRTAFAQLNYSLTNLLGTSLALFVTFLMPLLMLIFGIVFGNQLAIMGGSLSWLLMTFAYISTIRLFQIPFIWVFSFPFASFLYLIMTLASAIYFWRGRGGSWKGRYYH